MEKQNLASDYENYKVRVHSVLKQQKSKESQQPAVQPDTAEMYVIWSFPKMPQSQKCLRRVMSKVSLV